MSFGRLRVEASGPKLKFRELSPDLVGFQREPVTYCHNLPNIKKLFKASKLLDNLQALS